MTDSKSAALTKEYMRDFLQSKQVSSVPQSKSTLLNFFLLTTAKILRSPSSATPFSLASQVYRQRVFFESITLTHSARTGRGDEFEFRIFTASSKATPHCRTCLPSPQFNSHRDRLLLFGSHLLVITSVLASSSLNKPSPLLSQKAVQNDFLAFFLVLHSTTILPGVPSFSFLICEARSTSAQPHSDAVTADAKTAPTKSFISFTDKV